MSFKRLFNYIKVRIAFAFLALTLFALPAFAGAGEANWLFGSDGYSTATFTGAGLNDATLTGACTDLTATTFTVTVDGTGTPDTFKWRKGSGSWTTGVAMTGAAQSLSDGVSVTFGATTGHTLADSWSFNAASVSTTYQLGGPGFVAVRVYGVGGTATATVVIEEKLRDDEETWGQVKEIATSFTTTAATWNGTASGNLRVRISSHTSGKVKGTITAFNSYGYRIIPF